MLRFRKLGGLGAFFSRTSPTLDYPTATNPPVVGAHIPVDAISGDVLTLFWSQDVNFITGVSSGSHTLLDTDTPGSTITGFGIPTLSTGAPWYFQARLTPTGAFSLTPTGLRAPVAWNDAVAPTITTNAAQSQVELFPLAVALTANKTVAWAITGGIDQTQFTISGSTLEWFGNGTQDFTQPQDSDANNTYIVQVTATDLAGNTTNLTITVTVTAANRTPNPFNYVNVVPSAPSTTYSTVGTAKTGFPISGMTAGLNVPASLSGSASLQWSKDGGATWHSPASLTSAQDGDTIDLQVTSGPGASDVATSVLTVGTYSTTWKLSNTSIVTQFSAATADKASAITLSNGNLTASTTDTSLDGVRTDQAQSTLKRQIEFTVGALPGEMACGFEDGTTVFGPATAAVLPGGNDSVANSLGVVFVNGSWGWEIHAGSTTPAFSDYASATHAVAAEQALSFVVDFTPAVGSRTIDIYRTVSGTTTHLGQITGLSFTSLHGFCAMNTSGGTWTMNAGASPFTRPLGAGEVAFGS